MQAKTGTKNGSPGLDNLTSNTGQGTGASAGEALMSHDNITIANSQGVNLSARHIAMLQSSAITSEVIAARGYRSIAGGDGAYKALQALGFNHKQAIAVASKDVLLLPIRPPDGTNGLYMIRPDNPRVFDDKDHPLGDGTYRQTVLKYEQPRGASNRLDVNPLALPGLADPSKDLWFTEGIKKGDSLTAAGLIGVSLPGGVYGFLGKNAYGASTVLADFDHIAWKNGDSSPRRVFIVFDSDVMEKPQVRQALKRLTYIIRNKGARVTPVVLPGKQDGGKIGVDDFLASGGTVEQLYQLAGTSDLVASVLDAGEVHRQLKSGDYVASLRLLGYEFRMNALNDTVEVNGEPISDPTASRIRTDLRDNGIDTVRIAEDVWIAHAQANAYHPIRDYLISLQWDGRPHIDRLAGFFEDAHRRPDLDSPCPVFHTYLRRWMIGAVAKALDGHQNMMLVLDGEQRIGKSSLVSWLASGVPHDYFIEAPIHPDDKDHKVYLASRWIWEVMELGSTTRRQDIDALKGFITLRDVTVRQAYGRYSMRKPALASFIGTVNKDTERGFLVDPTGNARFMVCTLTKIDWRGYTAKVDPNQLWAEAVALYRAGEAWQLTIDERQLQAELNEHYEADRGVLDWILALCTISESRADFTTTQQIAAKLQEAGYRAGSTEILHRDVGYALRKLGLEKGQRRLGGKGGTTGYYGILLKP